MSSSETVIHFDHILDAFVGPGGPWQWRQFLLILAQTLANSAPFMLHIFTANVPEHRCKVPNCDVGNSTSYAADFVNFTIPVNSDLESFLNEDQTMSKCQRYQHLGQQCREDMFSKVDKTECQDYVYDYTTFKSTTATEFDLVCDDSYKAKLVGSLLMVGLTMGCMIGGPLGDKIGRRRTLVGALLILAPTVILEAFVPNYWLYATTRLVVFTTVGVMWVSSHTLLLELFGTFHRKVAYTINGTTFSVNNAVLALIAYFERDWRMLNIWIGIIVASLTPFIFFFLKESLRWLIINGREEEAQTTLLKVAKVNNRHLSDTQCKEMRMSIEKMAATAKQNHERQLSVIHMFKKGYLSTTLIVLTVWITGICSFYALALNVGSLAGDIFLNYAVSSLVDVPATIYILLTIDRMGRKRCIVTALITLGLCCLGMAFVPKSESKIIMGLYLLGRFSSTVTVNTAWFYTAELFPTNMRAQSVATCSLVARVFGTSASFVSGLSSVWQPLPMLVLGAPALVSAALTTLLPETMGRELKEMAREDEEDYDDKEMVEIKL